MPENPKIKVVLIPVGDEAKDQQTLEGPDALQALLDRLMSEAPSDDIPEPLKKPNIGRSYVIRGVPDEHRSIIERSIHPDVAAYLDELVRINNDLRMRMHRIRQYT